MAAAKTIIEVEGISDWLAVASVGLPPDCAVVTNTGGAKSRGTLPRPWSKGKKIIDAGDADEPGEEGKKQSAAAYVQAGAAEVFLGQLPYEIQKDHGRDIRDWLQEGHAVADLPIVAVTAKQAAEWGEPEGENGDAGRVKNLADAICLTDHFAQDAGGKLYRYKDGAYQPHGDKHVKTMVKALLIGWGDTKAWSTRLANEVVEFIRVDAPQLWERPPEDMINLENGLLRVQDSELLPHTPDHLSPVQLPVKFDPAATCPNIESFVATTFPADAHSLAWEIVGVLMVIMTWLQKAILLLGDGCNGKSVWLSLLIRYLGRQNVATMPLHKLEADKFSSSRLIGKLANICADLPSEHLAGTSTFKALTGGDMLPAEYKFKDSFDFLPFARLVFSANHPPRSADSSGAFFRRWVVIPFDRVFLPEDQIPRHELDARLQSPEELSGLLNKALEGLRRVQEQRGLSESDSTQAAWRDFQATTDPLAVWLERYTIDGPDAFCPGKMLRIAYNAAAEREGRPTFTDTAFGRELRKHRPTLEYKQRTVGGRLQWCHIGIGLVADDSQTSQGSQGYHYPVPIAGNYRGGERLGGDGRLIDE